MKRRTLLAAGGGVFLAAGGGLMLWRPQPQQTLLPGAANAQSTDDTLPEVPEMFLGNPDAEVEVIEYASYTCPHCASFHANQYQAIKSNYIDTNRIKFTYREVYFDRPGLWASMIARCTGDTDFFFAFSSLLYEQQSNWLASGDPAAVVQELRKLAKTAGMDDATLDSCLSDAAKAEALYNWYQTNVERDGITGTPSFIIDGEKYSNMPYDEFAEVLDGKLS